MIDNKTIKKNKMKLEKQKQLGSSFTSRGLKHILEERIRKELLNLKIWINSNFKRNLFMKNTVMMIILFFSISKIFGQSNKMLRIEYLNASSLHNNFGTNINPIGISGPTYTNNNTLNSLLGNYNVSYYAPYYSKDVLDSSLRNYYAVYLSGNADSLKLQLAALNITNQIEILSPDSLGCTSPIPITDQLISLGWANNYAINLCDAQCGWTITKGDPSIRLAIADTDFETTHDDLKNRIREVYGPITGQHEHGTTVLGTAGAEPNNIGIVGTGYNLMWDGARVPHKINTNGSAGGYPDIGVTNAVNKGARVINVSWTGMSYSHDAVQDLINRGFILVVAAGNNPNANCHYDLGDIPGVIIVSGVDQDGYCGPTNHARNNRVDLCAMSINVTCTKNNNSYGGAWGTSNAAPQVTAAAGLILSLNPCFTPAQVEYILKNTTKPIKDAATYSGLVGTGYLDVYSALKFAKGRSGILATNETWNTTEILGGELIVPSGKTLTIKSQVLCYNNASITVKSGGKLIIDGGELVSICGSWKGIRVEGNYLQNQSNLANIGFLQMINNAKISDALNAVSLSGLNSSGGIDWSKSGGLIQATNSQFINNYRDVEFMSYHPRTSSGNEVANRSFFKNCNFITNNNLKFWNNGHAHVTMWDVNGVQFLGCSFENNRTYISRKDKLSRIGIYTANSNYIVSNNCSNPNQIPCYNNPSKFVNLYSAIESYGNGSKGVISIENSEFNSYKGAFLQGTDGTLIRHNTFTITHDPIIPLSTNYPYGAYLDKCQRFNTEDNQFTGTTNSTNVINGGAAGLVIRNTGANNNEFYRNYFDNLKVASQALSENRDAGINGLVKGLTFICNNYENNFNDLDVRDDPNNPATNSSFLGMKELQGQYAGMLPLPPSNFFGNSSSILNFNIENKGNYLQYLHTGSPNPTNTFFPNIVTNATVARLNSFGTAARTCESRIPFWGQNKEILISSLISARPILIAKNQQIKSLTDGGNTTSLKNLILTVTPSNVSFVVSQLLSYSPYLGNEVLALVATQDMPFTQTMIRDILLANPHSARCLLTKNMLDARPNPLPQTYRNQIDSNINIYSNRDTLGAELSTIMEDYDFKLHELIFAYETDSSMNISNYACFLKHPTNPTYYYQLAEKYFENGDWSNFIATRDSIPAKLNLNTKQLAYHVSFTSFYNLLHNWQLTGVSLYEPNLTRKNCLLNFANSHLEYPARLHALLAVNDTFINRPNVFIPESSGVTSILMTLNSETIENNKQNSQIILYPNPVQNSFSLEWQNSQKPSYISVSDLQGKIVLTKDWLIDEKCQISTDKWPNGVYFVRVISSSENTAIIKKIIVNK